MPVTGPVSSADSDTTGQHATAASLSGTAGAVGDIGGGLGAEGRMATQGQNNMHGKGKPAASKQSAQRRPRKKQTDEKKAAKKLDALNQRYRCSAI